MRPMRCILGFHAMPHDRVEFLERVWDNPIQIFLCLRCGEEVRWVFHELRGDIGSAKYWGFEWRKL